MEKLFETFKLPINIIMHDDSPIEKFNYSIYNGQLLVSTFVIVCVDNGKCFYLNENGKLDPHVIVKKRYTVQIFFFHLMH